MGERIPRGVTATAAYNLPLQAMNRAARTRVAICVPVRDEFESLPALLESFAQQSVSRDCFIVCLLFDGCADGGEHKQREEAVTSHSPRSSGEPRAGGSECNYVYNVEGESLTPKIDSFITDHICGTQAYLPEEPFTSDGLGGGGGEQKVEGRDVVIELEDDSECSCGLEHEGSRVQAALGALRDHPEA